MKVSILLKLLAGAALLAALAGIVVQRGQTIQLAKENQSLRELEQEAQQLAEQNAELPRLRLETADLETLRAEAKAIDKLRSEFWRNRPLLKDREKLVAENQRLAALPKAPPAAAPSLAQMPDFVPASAFSNAGFSTPENALQTLFYAMKTGDLELALQCMAPEPASRLREDLARMTETARTRHTEEMRSTFHAPGYRIAERQVQSEDRVVLGFQVIAQGESHRLNFQRVSNEWKFAP